MKRSLIKIVLESREDEPERKFYLPSGFKGKMIILWEDIVDLEARYVSESEIPKEVLDLLKTEKDKCEFYPRLDEDCVCAAGSDISGAFLCTKEYSEKCQWADIARKAVRDGD